MLVFLQTASFGLSTRTGGRSIKFSQKKKKLPIYFSNYACIDFIFNIMHQERTTPVVGDGTCGCSYWKTEV